MKRILWNGRLVLLAALPILSAVWVVGCQDLTVAPAENVVYSAPHLVQYTHSSKTTRNLELTDEGSDDGSGLVRARQGGHISSGNFELFVPAGALPANTVLTLVPSSEVDMACALEPTGTVFLKPVTLKFRYQETDADDDEAAYVPGVLEAVWLDPSSSRWVGIGGTDDSDGKEFSVSLDHFSYYALSKHSLQ